MSFKSKDNVYVVRGESSRAARIIGEQRDDQGERLISAFVRYHDDREPLTEWVNPSDLVSKETYEKAKALADKKSAKKSEDADDEEKRRQAILNDADAGKVKKEESNSQEQKRQIRKGAK